MRMMDLEADLPPVMSRNQVESLLGGVISGRTLANLDSRGEGPEGRFYIGRKAAYPTRNLLAWLDSRMRVAG